jgi:hypothetical protein
MPLPPKTLSTKLLVVLIFILLPVLLPAQITLTGQLRDSLTGDPISFATVYLDGTSTGDVTSDDGAFTLGPVSLPATLVVSHLNYHNQTINLTTDPSGPLNIQLRSREEVLAGVEVKDQDLRAKNIKEFRRLLLGTDDWGDNSSFLNGEVVNFDRDYVEKELKVNNDYMRQKLVERDRADARWSIDGQSYFFTDPVNLKATTRSALSIRLPHLGYTVRMDLNSFLAEYRSGRMAYLGTFFFQPDDRLRPRYLKNRQRAYWGSPMHFARSLLADSLAGNGFKVVEIIKDPNTGKEATADVTLGSYLKPTPAGFHELAGLAGREFAVLYYGDNQFRPLPEKKWRRAQPVQSRFIVESNRCLILPGGAFGDAGIAFSGNMGTRGLAWILPQDYVPDQNR